MTDLLPYLKGDGRPYELEYKIAGNSGTQTVQTQEEGKLFYNVKGQEWERLYWDPETIYREADTSEAPDKYYVQMKDGVSGADWVKRNMDPGEEYQTDLLVKHYWKATGELRAEAQVSNTLRLVAVHDTYTFKSGIILQDVVEMAWIIGGQPEELYYYAKGYGLVAWKQVKRGWESYICEELLGRPDLVREVVRWLPDDPSPLYYKPTSDIKPCLMRVVGSAATMLSVRTGPGINHDRVWKAKGGTLIQVNSAEKTAPGNVWAEWGSGLWCAIEYNGDTYMTRVDGGEALVPDEPFRLLRPKGYVTQLFGKRPEVYARWNLPGHEGIDFGVPIGSTVRALHDGTVYRVHLKDDNNYGIHVRIAHVFPNGKEYKTIQAHMRLALVKVGDVVVRGQPVGEIGLTGNTTGPHEHTSLKEKGATAAGLTNYPGDFIDPALWIDL